MNFDAQRSQDSFEPKIFPDSPVVQDDLTDIDMEAVFSLQFRKMRQRVAHHAPQVASEGDQEGDAPGKPGCARPVGDYRSGKMEQI